MAMQATIGEDKTNNEPICVAQRAVEYADALIGELNKL